MRIQSLHIGKAIAPDAPQEALLVDETVSKGNNVGRGFKSLQEFKIQFDDDKNTELFRPTVIVGENGTGKTNLLEALVTIFRDLDLDPKQKKDRTPFAYTLKYECKKKQLHIYAKEQEIPSFVVDGQPITKADFQRQKDDLLPRHIFCYYSGNNPRLARLFYTHQKNHLDDLTTKYEERSKNRDISLELQRFFYAKTVHSKFVLLSFFTEGDQKSKDFLAKEFGITGLESVLFEIRKPTWATGTRVAKGSDVERFWRAKGLVKVFLNHLYEYSFAPLELPDVRIQRDFNLVDREDLLCLYLESPEKLQALVKKHYPKQQQFFDALESTDISDLLEDVKVLLLSNRSKKPIAFSELSEGEQQLLTVFGLLRFTKQEESLVLLDEPDTHLNPTWGWQYFDMLQQAVDRPETSHFIMVTHDPLVISGLRREQVQVLRRQSETHISAEPPKVSPRGAGIAGILMSEMYGLRGGLDKYTLELLEEKRILAVTENLSPKQRNRLRSLQDMTEELGFTRDDKDPNYKRFLDALYKRNDYQSIIKKEGALDSEEIEALERMAIEALEDLRTVMREGQL